ncbi:MAG: DUF429 domain-containing protein [Thermoanaerobaculia bacterium]
MQNRQKPVATVGLDLSGPVNSVGTGVAVFRDLEFQEYDCDGSDASILALLRRLTPSYSVAIGMDAPLSYPTAGGFRERDHSLRAALRQAEINPNSVIPPLAPRMVYLTLRGVAVSRLLQSEFNDSISIVEVHPTACLGLRGAPIDDVLNFKRHAGARSNLLNWFREQGMRGLEQKAGCTDHFIAACSAALATWKWAHGKHVWQVAAEPPFHPYGFVC